MLFFFVFSSPSPTYGQNAVLVSSTSIPIRPYPTLIQAPPCQQHYLSSPCPSTDLLFFLLGCVVSCRPSTVGWGGEGPGGALPTRHHPIPPCPIGTSALWRGRKHLRCKLNLCRLPCSYAQIPCYVTCPSSCFGF